MSSAQTKPSVGWAGPPGSGCDRRPLDLPESPDTGCTLCDLSEGLFVLLAEFRTIRPDVWPRSTCVTSLSIKCGAASSSSPSRSGPRRPASSSTTTPASTILTRRDPRAAPTRSCRGLSVPEPWPGSGVWPQRCPARSAHAWRGSNSRRTYLVSPPAVTHPRISVRPRVAPTTRSTSADIDGATRRRPRAPAGPGGASPCP